MNTFKALGVVLLFATALLSGCQDDPGSDLSTGPDDNETGLMDGVAGPPVPEDAAQHFKGGSAVVYTLSNAVAGNAVLRFSVSSGGSLTADGSFNTGGTGTGAGLGSQGALVKRGNLLFAVNAGSNDVSVLREKHGGLELVKKIASGGMAPISLTVKGDVLYVLNAGGAGNIAGFRGALSGHLRPIAGSILPLSGAAVGPAQIEFSPTRNTLVVTEKATNKILTYKVGHDGRAHGPIIQNSAGQTPFGFEFTPRGHLVVSEAFGGAPLASALSSYRIDRAGTVNVVTGPVATMQTAACWVVISPDGRFAYTTNNGTNNISGYRIAHNGGLTLFADGGNTATTDPGPIDMALSDGSLVLYCLNAGGNSITSYKRNPFNGTLTAAGSVHGLPAGAAGLAAD
ncbi:MAG: beta-propeller fold lactonase family protein [Bacteroidetes bacterium]|nr:beta-propeller fold lactonase family protein [Bacteroidota bacterium]